MEENWNFCGAVEGCIEGVFKAFGFHGEEIENSRDMLVFFDVLGNS